MRRAAAVVSLVPVLLAGCGTRAQPDTRASSPPPRPAAHIVATTQISRRMWDLTVDSPAVGARVRVRLLLPSGFTAEPARRWPVLYLLHGCCDTYVSWSRSTDIERRTEDVGAIVVMPDGGPVGFYSDWRVGPAWETFHLTELGEILSGTYRAGGPRAIAGLSMGGLGALDYAARHPGMFTVAASFSGIVDTRLSESNSRRYAGLVRSRGEDPRNLWGDPVGDADLWRAHNPYDLAPRLRGVKVFVSAGDGRPGPLDAAGTGPDGTEASLRAENDAFATRLRELGIDATIDLYRPGTHNWVYWQRELDRAWPLILGGLGGSGRPD